MPLKIKVKKKFLNISKGKTKIISDLVLPFEVFLIYSLDYLFQMASTIKSGINQKNVDPPKISAISKYVRFSSNNKLAPSATPIVIEIPHPAEQIIAARRLSFNLLKKLRFMLHTSNKN